MKNKQERLIELQSRWESNRDYNPFVRDGILNLTDWEKSFPKTMFLMKESHRKANWYEIAGSPIEPIAKDGTCKVIWRNILRWKHLIETTREREGIEPFPPFETLPDVKRSNGKLSSIAYVNVSKALGDPTSNPQFIRDTALKDKEYLTEQIDIIDPDVILCASTFWAYHVAYHPSDCFTEIAPFAHKHKERLIIDFNHPSPPGGNREEHLHRKLSEILSNPAVKKQIANQALQTTSASARRLS